MMTMTIMINGCCVLAILCLGVTSMSDMSDMSDMGDTAWAI
jgi:hypothetical protein